MTSQLSLQPQRSIFQNTARNIKTQLTSVKKLKFKDKLALAPPHIEVGDGVEADNRQATNYAGHLALSKPSQGKLLINDHTWLNVIRKNTLLKSRRTDANQPNSDENKLPTITSKASVMRTVVDAAPEPLNRTNRVIASKRGERRGHLPPFKAVKISRNNDNITYTFALVPHSRDNSSKLGNLEFQELMRREPISELHVHEKYLLPTAQKASAQMLAKDTSLALNRLRGGNMSSRRGGRSTQLRPSTRNNVKLEPIRTMR